MADFWICKGIGTGADASSENGGGGIIGTNAWADTQGANGGPVDAIVNATYTLQGGAGTDDLLTKTDEFVNAAVGMWVYIDSVLEGSSERVQIKVVNSDDSIEFATVAWTNGRADVTTNVGGALAGTTGGVLDGRGLQIAFDTVDAGDSIRITPGTYTLLTTTSDTIEVDGTPGTEALHVTIEGVNATTGVRLSPGDTLPVITAGEALAGNGVFNVVGSTIFYDWYGVDVNGGGVEAFCIYINDGGSTNQRFFDCKVHNTSSNVCFFSQASYTVLVNCEVYMAGGQYGAWLQGSNSVVMGCSFHDNTGRGLVLHAGSIRVLNCWAYGNTVDGIHFTDSGTRGTCYQCTCENNGDDGIYVADGADTTVVANDSCSNNTTYNYNFNADITHLGLLSHCHAYGGTNKAYDIGNDTAWLTAGQGNNIGGDPLYTSVANDAEDYTPQAGSPLLGAGFPQRFGVNAVLNAVTNYAHMGASTPDIVFPGGSNPLVSSPGPIIGSPITGAY